MSKSLPSNRRRHAPRTPSPLNPNNTAHPNSNKTRQQPSKTSNTPNPATSLSLAQKYALLVNASPTERLLRQKAALAWRSETLRHGGGVVVHRSSSSSSVSQLQPPQPQPSLTAVRSNRRHHHPAAFLTGQRGDGCEKKDHELRHLRPGGWDDVDFVVSVPVPDLLDSTDAEREEEEESRVEEADISLAGVTSTIIPITTTTDKPADARGVRFEGFIRFDDGYGDGDGDGDCVDGSRPLMRARGGRRRCHGKGGVGASGITARRVVIVVALLLGLGLVHGLVNAFWSGGGGGGGVGGGRPLATES